MGPPIIPGRGCTRPFPIHAFPTHRFFLRPKFCLTELASAVAVSLTTKSLSFENFCLAVLTVGTTHRRKPPFAGVIPARPGTLTQLSEIVQKLEPCGDCLELGQNWDILLGGLIAVSRCFCASIFLLTNQGDLLDSIDDDIFHSSGGGPSGNRDGYSASLDQGEKGSGTRSSVRRRREGSTLG